MQILKSSRVQKCVVLVMIVQDCVFALPILTKTVAQSRSKLGMIILAKFLVLRLAALPIDLVNRPNDTLAMPGAHDMFDYRSNRKWSEQRCIYRQRRRQRFMGLKPS